MIAEEKRAYSMDEAQEMEEIGDEEEYEDSSEDLEQKKQKINEFNVEGNYALNQMNIQTLNLKVNYNTKSETEKNRAKEQYDLKKKMSVYSLLRSTKMVNIWR